MSTNFAAYVRQRARISTFGIVSFFARPSSFSTFSSIGSPWQSQPGTYGAHRPVIARCFTMTSFRTLLSAVPRWM
jgi:hypothetical protein